jgi:3-phosphoshikimate 1-carboxyvinyltransferase
MDSRFLEVAKHKPMKLSRRTDLGDAVMMAAVLGSFWPRGTSITDAGRLREQETDRLAALEKELNKCGAKAKAWPTWLEISPVPQLNGAEIETYDDHRMAMSFSILGLKVPGMVIRNPQCVSKTFPEFFETLQDMARQSGHGPVVVDAKTRKPLA